MYARRSVAAQSVCPVRVLRCHKKPPPELLSTSASRCRWSKNAWCSIASAIPGGPVALWPSKPSNCNGDDFRMSETDSFDKSRKYHSVT